MFENRPTHYRIIALVTVFNRQLVTNQFLNSFFSMSLPGNINIELGIIDDGSTDGTDEMLKKDFPDVKVMRTKGNYYWAGGMRLAYESFASANAFDYILALNDDVILRKEAIAEAFRYIQDAGLKPEDLFALALSVIDPHTKSISYGGFKLISKVAGMRFELINPCSNLKACDTLNMNIALISSGAIKKIGFLSKEFTHHRADIDYGLRLSKVGGSIFVLPGIYGECSNPPRISSQLIDMSVRDRFRLLISKKESPPKERLIFYWRHGGPFLFLPFIAPYITTFFPRLNAFLRSGKRQII